jgi:hypothetical protein
MTLRLDDLRQKGATVNAIVPDEINRGAIRRDRLIAPGRTRRMTASQKPHGKAHPVPENVGLDQVLLRKGGLVCRDR